MKPLDLLVVGDANPDVLLAGAPAIPPYGQAETLVASGALALGGSAAITAHGAARLGLSTALAAMVGRDAAGDFVLDALTTAGVDVTACVRHESLPTALTVCLTAGDAAADRAVLTAPGFLAGFLATGDLAHALALGCACGSLSTRAAGGTAAQPDLVEAAALAARIEIR